jgi:DNA repair exonuclease SbcCD ATPase subunit
VSNENDPKTTREKLDREFGEDPRMRLLRRELDACRKASEIVREELLEDMREMAAKLDESARRAALLEAELAHGREPLENRIEAAALHVGDLEDERAAIRTALAPLITMPEVNMPADLRLVEQVEIAMQTIALLATSLSAVKAELAELKGETETPITVDTLPRLKIDLELSRRNHRHDLDAVHSALGLRDGQHGDIGALAACVIDAAGDIRDDRDALKAEVDALSLTHANDSAEIETLRAERAALNEKLGPIVKAWREVFAPKAREWLAAVDTAEGPNPPTTVVELDEVMLDERILEALKVTP